MKILRSFIATLILIGVAFVLPVWADTTGPPDDPVIVYPNSTNEPNWCDTEADGWCNEYYETCSGGTGLCSRTRLSPNPTIFWETPADGDDDEVWLDLQLKIVRDDGDGCGTDDFPAKNSITGVEYYWGTFDGTDPDCHSGSPAHCDGAHGAGLSHFVNSGTSYHAGTFADDLAGEDGLRGFCSGGGLEAAGTPCLENSECDAGDTCEMATYCVQIYLMDDDGEWAGDADPWGTPSAIEEFKVTTFPGRLFNVSKTSGVNATCASGADVGNTCYHLSGTEECDGGATCAPSCCEDGNADGVNDTACKDLGFALFTCISDPFGYTDDGAGGQDDTGAVVVVETGVTHDICPSTEAGGGTGHATQGGFDDEGYACDIDFHPGANNPTTGRCATEWGTVCTGDGDCPTTCSFTRIRATFPSRVLIRSDTPGTRAVFQATTNIAGKKNYAGWGADCRTGTGSGCNDSPKSDHRGQYDVIWKDLQFQGHPDCCDSDCKTASVDADNRCTSALCVGGGDDGDPCSDVVDNTDCTSGDCTWSRCCSDATNGCCISPLSNSQHDAYVFYNDYGRNSERITFRNMGFENFIFTTSVAGDDEEPTYQEGIDNWLIWDTDFDGALTEHGSPMLGEDTTHFDTEMISGGAWDWFTVVGSTLNGYRNGIADNGTDSGTTPFQDDTYGLLIQENLFANGAIHSGVRALTNYNGVTFLGNTTDGAAVLFETDTLAARSSENLVFENNTIFAKVLKSNQDFDANYFVMVNNAMYHFWLDNNEDGQLFQIDSGYFTGATRLLIDYNFWSSEVGDEDDLFGNLSTELGNVCPGATCYAITDASGNSDWADWQALGYDLNSPDLTSNADAEFTAANPRSDYGDQLTAKNDYLSDFSLQATSDLVDAGHPAYAVPAVDESDGGIDIGAHELEQLDGNTLTVVRPRGGTVVDDVAGLLIDCGETTGDCVEAGLDADITMDGTAEANWTFRNWLGETGVSDDCASCSTTEDGCTASTSTASQTCLPTYETTMTFVVNDNCLLGGNATVSDASGESDDVSGCTADAGDCSGVYEAGEFGNEQKVVYTAVYDIGCTISSWEGCDSFEFTDTTCTVSVASANNVTTLNVEDVPQDAPTMVINSVYRDDNDDIQMDITVDDVNGDILYVIVAYKEGPGPCSSTTQNNPGVMLDPTPLSNLTGGGLGSSLRNDLLYQIRKVVTAGGPANLTLQWDDPPAVSLSEGDLCISFMATDLIANTSIQYQTTGTTCDAASIVADLDVADVSSTGYYMTFDCLTTDIPFVDTALGDRTASNLTIDGQDRITFSYTDTNIGTCVVGDNGIDAPPIMRIAGADVLIKDMIFTDFLESIQVNAGGARASFTGNTFNAHSCSDDALSFNDISGTTCLTSTPSILVDDNIFNNYTDKAIQMSCGDGIISGNTFNLCKQPMRAPYNNSANGTWTIDSNLMLGDDTTSLPFCDGPWFSGSGWITFSNNTIQDCRRGLFLGSATDQARSPGEQIEALVYGNTFDSNGRFGILVTGAAHARVYQNIITDNGGTTSATLANGGAVIDDDPSTWTSGDTPEMDLGGGSVSVQGNTSSSIGRNVITGNDFATTGGAGALNVRELLTSGSVPALVNCWDATVVATVEGNEIEGTVTVDPLGVVAAGPVCNEAGAGVDDWEWDWGWGLILMPYLGEVIYMIRGIR